MRLKAARRWLVATGMVATLVGLTGAPAVAQSAAAPRMFVDDVLLAANGDGTVFGFSLYATPTEYHTKITATYDVTDLADVATVWDAGTSPEVTCTRAGAIVTCVADEAYIGEQDPFSYYLRIKPLPGAVPDTSGVVKITVSSPHFGTITQTAKVTVAEVIDLAAVVPPKSTAEPGDSFTVPLRVVNVGSPTIHGVVAYFRAGVFIEAGQKYSNCTYAGNSPRSCRFDTDLRPGREYQVDLPLKISDAGVAPRDGGEAVTWYTPARYAGLEKWLNSLDGEVLGKPGVGGKLSLRELAPAASSAQTQIDINGGGYADIPIDIVGMPDISASRGTASGAVGAKVQVKVRAVNRGKAVIRFAPDEPVLDFIVPTGATVTTAPQSCRPLTSGGVGGNGAPGGREYRCYRYKTNLGPKRTLTYLFELRLDRAGTLRGTERIVTTRTAEEFAKIDTDPSNNEAEIVLTARAPGAPGGGDPAEDDGLPITGAPVALITAAGLLLIGIGFVLFQATRSRRRTAI
ncbi:hypothetical protein AB0M47_40110 [Hamadaea sp. NPDC051192]|uniref:hypothetical protein n=1 Tax=Hamadaea sp. NPDC051192 TaxID=3154940 RepID=UPI0034382CF5